MNILCLLAGIKNVSPAYLKKTVKYEHSEDWPKTINVLTFIYFNVLTDIGMYGVYI
jgi:hypothetical protein